MRLQKALAHLGLGSRRQIEQWILNGRITVDGEIAELGLQVTPSSQIRVDGRLIQHVRPCTRQTLMYHKPLGEICSRRTALNQTSVFDALPSLQAQRWVSVGRLDVNSSGLLLFTTDGDLAHKLMHPSSELEREYQVRVQGTVKQGDIERLRNGVMMDGAYHRFERVEHVRSMQSNHWYRVVLKEGKYREVRRLWEAVNLRVSRLIRIRYASLVLPRDLKPGNFQMVSESQLNQFMRQLEKK